MSKRSVRLATSAGLLIGACVVVIANGRAEDAEQPTAASKLVQAAKAAQEAATTTYEAGQCDAEQVYLWSRRLVNAEIRAGAGPTAALQHVNRMRRLHERVAALHRAGRAGGEGLWLQATTFYLEEAQLLALKHANP